MKLTWRKWVLIILAAGLCCLLVFVGFRWYLRIKAAEHLEEVIAELDRTDPGWHLNEIEASRKKIPDKENGALIVLAAGKLLPQTWPPPPAGDAGRARIISPFDPDQRGPMDAILDFPPEVQLTGFLRNELNKEPAKVEKALKVARTMKKYPQGRYPLTYAPDWISTLVPHMDSCRPVSSLLGYDAISWADKKDLNKAWDSFEAQIHTGNSLGDEPFMISLLIRNAICATSLATLERLLAQGVTQESRLRKAQQILANEETVLLPVLVHMLRGERAGIHFLLQGVEKGDLSLTAIMDLKGGKQDDVKLWDRINEYLIMNRVYHSHAAYLREMGRIIAIARLPLEKQVEQMAHFEWSEEIYDQTAVLAKLFIMGVNKVLPVCYRTIVFLRCAQAALAAERFRLKQGRWPKNLSELLQAKLLPQLPIDPYDGKHVKYKKTKDGVVVYSVGMDRIDNGGTINRKRLNEPGTDLGFRLWNVSRRRQSPPETPKEQPHRPPTQRPKMGIPTKEAHP